MNTRDLETRVSGLYELPRGCVVGKYEIMRRLAVGGMAEIYLARVTGAAGFEKLVVLKRILPSVANDPVFVQMFLDEAKIAATLRHPNIADVYDVGEADGTYFFTMEYVYGQDARSIRHEAIKNSAQVPLAVALAVVHGTASALDHAHGRMAPDGTSLGLIHRDVSASNIMVSYDGAVKLLDFGIARAASSTHKTQTGSLKGNVPYMAPEQCKGLAMDRRSDLFSLGVVFYELTVGHRPFCGDNDFDIMDQIVHKGATPPSQLVPDFPENLEAMIMTLLARAPSQRYATGADLLHDLDVFVSKHGLWLSSRAIGKYMRGRFADKIEAWEQAEQHGVPFAQHVAHSITSQCQRSELLTSPAPHRGTSQFEVDTPPSSEQTPAVQPARVTPAPTFVVSRAVSLGRSSESMAAFVSSRPPGDSAVMDAIAAPMQAAQKPRSSRTIMLAFVAALVLGAGAVFGLRMSRDDDQPAVVEKDAPATRMMVERVPATNAVEPVPTVVTAVPVVDARPTAPADKPIAKRKVSPTRPRGVTPKTVDTDPTLEAQTSDPN